MDKKTTIIILSALGIITFPVKVIMELIDPNLVKSMIFAIVFCASIFLMSIFSAKLSENNSAKYSFKSPILSFFSALCSIGLLIYSIFLFKSSAPSDAMVQYFLLMMFCALSSLFFLGVSYSHVTGKNIFRKLGVIVFFPIIMYVLSLMVFFSFEFDDPSAYKILSQALMLMFFVYYSHFYIKCSEKNYLKRCFAFGIPAVTVSLCHAVPSLIRNPINSIDAISSISSITLSAYVFLFLMSKIKLVSEPEKANLF